MVKSILKSKLFVVFIVLILVLVLLLFFFSSEKSEKLKLSCNVLINQVDDETYFKYIEYYDNNIFKEKYIYNFSEYKSGIISYLKHKFKTLVSSQKMDDSLEFDIVESKNSISFVFTYDMNVVEGDKPDMYGMKFKDINVDSLKRTLEGGGYKCIKY